MNEAVYIVYGVRDHEEDSVESTATSLPFIEGVYVDLEEAWRNKKFMQKSADYGHLIWYLQAEQLIGGDCDFLRRQSIQRKSRKNLN